MPYAQLQISVGGGPDLDRAFARVSNAVRRVNQEMARESERAHQRERASEEATVRATERRYERTRIGQRRVLSERQVLEQTATRIVLQEHGRQAMSEMQLAQRRRQVLTALVMAHRDSERAMTGETERQSRRRNDLSRAGSGGFGSGGAGASGRFGWASLRPDRMVRAYASDIHGQIQGERQARATTERSLNAAFVQTGADFRERRAQRQQVYDFASRHGIREEEIAPALEQAQTRFAVLGGNDVASRRQALGDTLEAIRFGRMTGQDPRETATFFGALRARGMSTNSALAATRQATAIAYQGNVSLGQITTQALPSLMSSIASAQAREPTAGRDRQQEIVGEQMRNFFAELQLQAAVGGRPGVSGNRLRQIETALSNTNMMGVVRQRLIESAGTDTRRREMVTSMFAEGQAGERGELRREFRDPTQYAERLYQFFGGDPTAMANVMSARGSWSRAAGGRNRAMMQPQVLALANLFATNADTGETAFAAVRRLRNADLSPTAMRDIESGFEEEDDRRLAQDQQRRRDALREPGMQRDLSDRFASMAAEHPFLAAMVPAVGQGLLGGVFQRIGLGGAAGAAGGGGASLGGAALSVVPGGVAGGWAGPALFGGLGAAIMGLGGVLLAHQALTDPNTGPGRMVAAADAATGMTALQRLNPANWFGNIERAGDARRAQGAATIRMWEQMRQNELGDAFENATRGTGGAAPNLQQSFQRAQQQASSRSIGRDIVAALREQPLQVQMDPHSATHAASSTAQARNSGTGLRINLDEMM